MAKRGPRRWQPTDEERSRVRLYAGVGLSQEQIALLIRKSSDLLQRECRIELDSGKAEVLAKVGGKLVQKALSGDTASMIFYLKTQGGWRETNRTELAGSIEVKDGRTPEEVRQAIMGKLAVIAEASGTGEIPEKSDTGGA